MNWTWNLLDYSFQNFGPSRILSEMCPPLIWIKLSISAGSACYGYISATNIHPEVGQYTIEKYWKTNILGISILISAISKYWYLYLPFIYIDTNIDIEKKNNIDIDIGEIKSIFVNFYGIFAGLTYCCVT